MADTNDNVRIRVSTAGAPGSRRELDRTGRSVRGVGNEARRSSRSMGALGGATRGLGRGLTSLGRGALYSAAALGGMAVVLGKRSYDAYTETYKVGRATNQVIRSTGGLANVSANQVGNLATALSRKTGIDDEAIQSGENMLLTFRNIRNEAGRGNDIFNQSSRTLIDLATVMHRSPERAAIMLGKALNDPTKGLTALTRVGVTFDKHQANRIKWLVAHNRTLEAQRIILRELNTEFGGQAAARATPTEKLAVAWGNVEEAIGKVEHRFVDRLAPPMTRFFIRLEPRVYRFGRVLDQVWGSAGNLSLADKLQMSGTAARNIFRPLVREGRRSLRQAGFGPALGHAVDVATPIIAAHMARASGRAARAFARAWWHTDVWGKLFTAGIFLQRTGLLGSILRACNPLSKVMGGCLSGGMGKGMKGALGRLLKIGGAALATDAGLAVGGAAVAGLGAYAITRQAREHGTHGPGHDERAYRTSRPATGAYAGHHLDAQGFPITDAEWRRQQAQRRAVDRRAVQGLGNYNPHDTRAHGVAGHPYVDGRPVVVHSHVHLDGKEIARSVTRVAHRKAALR